MPGSSPGEMMDRLLAELKQKTGKDADSWAKAVEKSKIPVRKDQVEWLMREHGIGRVAANFITQRVGGEPSDYYDQDGLLRKMYDGPKASLMPIYERLIEIAGKLGPEFSLYQCAGQTTLKRRRQFAWIKPSTRTRVDLGLALAGMAPGGRLLPVSGTDEKDRVRLRIALSEVKEIDGEVAKWLKRAWDLDVAS